MRSYKYWLNSYCSNTGLGQCSINYMKHFMTSQLFDCIHNVVVTALYWCGDTSNENSYIAIFGLINEGVV